MNILTSNAHFRQRVVKKSYKVGVTEASKYYRISRQAIYEWRENMTARVGKVLLIKVTDRITIPMSTLLRKKN